MNITEKNRNEAETLIEIYFPHAYPFSAGSGYLTGDLDIESQRRFAARIAIQDRQSVLELVNEAIKDIEPDYSLFLHEKLTNLTEQINYLKSKL